MVVITPAMRQHGMALFHFIIFILFIVSLDQHSWVTTKISKQTNSGPADTTSNYGVIYFHEHYTQVTGPQQITVEYDQYTHVSELVPLYNNLIDNANPTDPYFNAKKLSRSALDATAAFIGIAVTAQCIWYVGYLLSTVVSIGDWIGPKNFGYDVYSWPRAIIPTVMALSSMIALITFASSDYKDTVCSFSADTGASCDYGSAYKCAVSACVFSFFLAPAAVADKMMGHEGPAVGQGTGASGFTGIGGTGTAGAGESTPATLGADEEGKGYQDV